MILKALKTNFVTNAFSRRLPRSSEISKEISPGTPFDLINNIQVVKIKKSSDPVIITHKVISHRYTTVYGIITRSLSADFSSSRYKELMPLSTIPYVWVC